MAGLFISCWPTKIICLLNSFHFLFFCSPEIHVLKGKTSERAVLQECRNVFKGKPPLHRALSVKRSNHSFVQFFFLSSATFSYHPLVPYQPDLLPVFISWPMYHKLKLSCPLPRVEIVGNPTVWELLNYFDSSLFFPSPPWALETGVVYVCV